MKKNYRLVDLVNLGLNSLSGESIQKNIDEEYIVS